MLLLFLSCLLHQALSKELGTVTVMTSKGSITGQRANDGNYTTYFGVPYAKVDEQNRFEDTLEYPNFTSPFIASDPSIKCPQMIFSVGGILQCLRLNIYVPDGPQRNLPVLVWFHGGGFAYGSAGEYNATHLVQQGIVVVTANYRLGPYGFICTSEIRNQGLNDQKKALRWIQKHIRSFGGDPSKVTIAGESWGGSAVEFLLYQGAEFNQAIIQSGTRFSYAVSTRVDNQAPIRFARRLGHNTTCHKDAMRFLNTADPIAVMTAASEYDYFLAVCEEPGDFQLDLKAKYAKKIKNTPIMIGVTAKETIADYAAQNDSFYSKVDGEFFDSLYKTFDLKNETIRELEDIIWRFYLGPRPISREVMLDIIDLSSDFQENYAVVRSVTNFLKMENPKVYQYVYSYLGVSPYRNMTGVGAGHTEDLPLLFEWWTKLETEEQFRMRRWIVKLWTNFVKYGDPTPENGLTKWPPSSLTSRPYLNIDEQSYVKLDFHQKRMAFWELLWTAYGQNRR